MNVEPCSVCGGTDVNLVDGFYYCIECGTQDTNARETVVEHTVLADGTFAHTAVRKFTTVLKDGVEMSGEWHKWHTYNFILSGLVDELIALGAKPSVRLKVLWVWTKYVKEFQVKEEVREPEFQDKEDNILNTTQTSIFEEDKVNNTIGDVIDEKHKKSSKKSKIDKISKDISVVTKGLLLSILYIGLNLDQSDIQLSHLLRYVREQRLSIMNCKKFIPKELNNQSIPHWRSFLCCTKEYNPNSIRTLAMSFFKKLDLGTPLVPDLRKIINNYVTELCLPDDFKNLVFSLMNVVPCDFLEVNSKSKCDLTRIPDFEGFAMSYVLVALKMCFGLDCEYEVNLSKTVDQINDEENYLKSYKLGMFSEPTDRLFSFREWSNFLQFRKIMLCKYNLPMAQQHNQDADDYVLMEQLGERNKRKIELSDEVTMDILNKIPLNLDIEVIPKAEFPPSLTPMSTYTEVIQQNLKDPELKLQLSEDFSQYSLKYACVDLMLSKGEDNIITGVSESNKNVSPVIVGTLVTKKADFSMVYVRNCENRNWLKTNPPTTDHITKIDENENENNKPIDQSDNCHFENTQVEYENKSETREGDTDVERKLEVIEKEDECNLIFDDKFEGINNSFKEDIVTDENVENSFVSHNDLLRDEDTGSPETAKHDLETFDRDKAIEELVLLACKTYKIPIPKEYKPTKRKSSLIIAEAGHSETKKRKVVDAKKRGEGKREMNKIMTAYYFNLQRNLFNEVSENVKSLVLNFNDDLNEPSHIATIQPSDNISSSIHNPSYIDAMNENVEDKSIPNDISIIDESVEDNYDIDDLIPKSDSKYDEKTHDIKQLYVKFKDQVKFDDIFNFDDPEINDFLDKKIAEHPKLKPAVLPTSDQESDAISYKSETDSEDDICLKDLAEEKKFLKQIEEQKKEKLEPLIKNKNIPEFKYWFRHYTTSAMKKNLDMQQRFDLELKENCPSSFNFVIRECAAILDCTAYSLYKCMQTLEQMIS